MCGIAGAWEKAQDAAGLARRVTAMSDQLALRGPDSSGTWIDPEQALGLGHRRLAIVDLSSAGHQPMASASRRYVISFNGEIYNHLELRQQLEAGDQAPIWRGSSDTETLLAGCEHWGIEETLKRAVGMFALALWDQRERTLYLTRDRLGEKPLYYGWIGGSFVFASELKALRAYPGFDNALCTRALGAYLRFMYVPAPLSIYERIYKLEPGCLLVVPGQVPPPPAQSRILRAGDTHDRLRIRRWWHLASAIEAGRAQSLVQPREAIEELEACLTKAVGQQMLADVPLGAFLSGGVDSSSIVSLMQAQSSRPVKTFTVGFTETGFDESVHAEAVARHLGTDQQTIMVTAAEALAVIPRLPRIYDEPFADSSQIPTYLICQAARQHVTVALSGDGGDELFGGYNRYLWAGRFWDAVGWMPFFLRQSLGFAMDHVPMGVWETVAQGRVSHAADKAHKLARCLRQARTDADLYTILVSERLTPEDLLKHPPAGGQEGFAPDEGPPASLLTDGTSLMMYCDTLGYLPDDILCKVDRAAMAVSLETRVPFLDCRVLECAWRLPLDFKLHGRQGKWALRQMLYRHVPESLLDRPKTGFSIPLAAWLRGPLRDWGEHLLEPSRLEQQGIFKVAPIRATWARHLAGQPGLTAKLWSILMFQAWFEAQSS